MQRAAAGVLPQRHCQRRQQQYLHVIAMLSEESREDPAEVPVRLSRDDVADDADAGGHLLLQLLCAALIQ